MTTMNTRVLLASRPTGAVRESDFSVVQAPIPEPSEGQFLVRNDWLSLDPYMRGRMNEGKSYAPRVEVGDVMVGVTVGTVVASRHAGFAVGDTVLTTLGWQAYGLSDGRGVQRLPAGTLAPQAFLGVAGMPGITAYVGLYDLGVPVAGETVLVSAAAGAVGSVVGQLARMRGCKAVGIAGGPAKCSHVVNDLGFDACVDYRAPDFERDLRAATPKGVDVLFENVGGAVMDASFRRLNPFARVPLCGLVSQYELTTPYGLQSFGALLVNRVRVQGFIVSDHMNRWPEAMGALAGWATEGKLVWRETVAHGLAEAPRAFMGMLKGQNLGKQLVKVS